MSKEKLDPKNRRAFIRRRPRGKARVICFRGGLDIGQNLAVGLADVSEGGVNLLLKCCLDKGQEVTLLLEGREHARPLKIHGNIAWCVSMEGGVFRAGVKLNTYLTYREILKIV